MCAIGVWAAIPAIGYVIRNWFQLPGVWSELGFDATFTIGGTWFVVGFVMWVLLLTTTRFSAFSVLLVPGAFVRATSSCFRATRIPAATARSCAGGRVTRRGSSRSSFKS